MQCLNNQCLGLQPGRNFWSSFTDSSECLANQVRTGGSWDQIKLLEDNLEWLNMYLMSFILFATQTTVLNTLI